MRKKYIHINSLILLSLLFINFSGTAWADQSPDQIESELLELINEARKDPLVMADSFGLDPNRVLSDLPELAEILTQGLPPLTRNEQLSDAALEHTWDMLDNSYYSSDSADGTTVTDRIITAGYLPISSGETLGILGFINFIEPGSAMQNMFKKMFLDELNPERSKNRNILNAEFEDVGIAFESGVFNFETTSSNVYMVTCDFAKSQTITTPSVGEMEQQLIELINQFRARPLEVIDSLGIDIGSAIESQPLLYTLLTTPVSPLVPSASLQAVSRGHSKDMLANNFVDHVSSDGKSLQDRMAAAGYIPLLSGEMIQLVAFTDITHGADAVYDILRNMIQSEITSYMESGSLKLLNPDLKDLGVGLEAGPFERDAETVHVLITTVALGATEEWKPLYIVGTVYVDKNNDRLNSLGEGVFGARIRLENITEGPGTGELKETLTNSAGGGMCPVDSGSYQVTILVPENESTEYVVFAEGENILLEHRLEYQGR